MNKEQRKSNRLKDYDYSQDGAYFVTICTKDREGILSKITVGANDSLPSVCLTEYGIIADDAVKSIPKHYNGIFVDNYVIMPNHIHMIIRIENNGGRMVSAPTVVGSFKRFVSKAIGMSIWQKGFYDHIIRDDNDYATKFQYIDENPIKWTEDKYFSITRTV